MQRHKRDGKSVRREGNEAKSERDTHTYRERQRERERERERERLKNGLCIVKRIIS